MRERCTALQFTYCYCLGISLKYKLDFVQQQSPTSFIISTLTIVAGQEMT